MLQLVSSFALTGLFIFVWFQAAQAAIPICDGLPGGEAVGLFLIVCFPIQSVSLDMMLLCRPGQNGGNNASTQIHSKPFMFAYYDEIQIGIMENGRRPHGSGAASRILADGRQQTQ